MFREAAVAGSAGLRAAALPGLELSLGPVRLHLNIGAAENCVALKDVSGSYFLRKPSK